MFNQSIFSLVDWAASESYLHQSQLNTIWIQKRRRNKKQYGAQTSPCNEICQDGQLPSHFLMFGSWRNFSFPERGCSSLGTPQWKTWPPQGTGDQVPVGTNTSRYWYQGTSRYWGPRQVGQRELETSLAQDTISLGLASCSSISLLKTAS